MIEFPSSQKIKSNIPNMLFMTAMELRVDSLACIVPAYAAAVFLIFIPKVNLISVENLNNIHGYNAQHHSLRVKGLEADILP